MDSAAHVELENQAVQVLTLLCGCRECRGLGAMPHSANLKFLPVCRHSFPNRESISMLLATFNNADA